MTLVADGERGIAMAKGDWEDEYAAAPSGNGSVRSVGTPSTSTGAVRKPGTKISLKDYKNMKETGVKPARTEAERKMGHKRDGSNVSVTAEGPVAVNGVGITGNAEASRYVVLILVAG